MEKEMFVCFPVETEVKLNGELVKELLSLHSCEGWQLSILGYFVEFFSAVEKKLSHLSRVVVPVGKKEITEVYGDLGITAVAQVRVNIWIFLMTKQICVLW